MKYLNLMTVMGLATVSLGTEVHKREKVAAQSATTFSESVSTVYSFLGATGSESSLLQMPTSGLSLVSVTSSSSIDESSALSQFLNGAPTASETTLLTKQAMSTGAVADDASGSSIESGEERSSSSQSTSANSNTLSSSDSVSSSTISATASAGGNTIRLPIIAGSVVAGLIALI